MNVRALQFAASELLVPMPKAHSSFGISESSFTFLLSPEFPVKYLATVLRTGSSGEVAVALLAKIPPSGCCRV